MPLRIVREYDHGGSQTLDPNDKSGFLHGDYAHGRRLAQFTGMAEVKSNTKALQNTLKLQLKKLKSAR